MRVSTAHRKSLAGMLAAALGAVLSLPLAAPASAAAATTAPAQPALAPADAGLSRAGTVTFQPGRGTDATIQARILCAWMVENPHHAANGDITTTARVLCSAPMREIGLGVALFREGGAPPAETIVNDNWVVALTADTSAPCLPGNWIAAMAVALVPPPGFFPSRSTGFAQSFVIPLGC